MFPKNKPAYAITVFSPKHWLKLLTPLKDIKKKYEPGNKTRVLKSNETKTVLHIIRMFEIQEDCMPAKPAKPAANHQYFSEIPGCFWQ